METQLGQTDALLAAYFRHEQQTLQGVQGSALGAHSLVLNGTSHGSVQNQACAVDIARQQQQNRLFKQGNSNNHWRIEQEHQVASAEDYASTAAAALAAEQPAAAAVTRQSSSTAAPPFTSPFAMPTGMMIPTPVTAATGFSPAALSMQMQQPSPAWFAASAASSASDFAAALQPLQQQQQQQAQQQQQQQQQQQFQQQLLQREQQQQQQQQQQRQYQQQLLQQAQQQQQQQQQFQQQQLQQAQQQQQQQQVQHQQLQQAQQQQQQQQQFQQQQLQQAQQQQQQQQQLFSHGSFSSTTLTAGTSLHAVPAAANSLAGGFVGPAVAAPILSSTSLPTHVPADDEPDLSHMTVMQRYHARRKFAVQRMEREVEQKIAQLALLEQENRKLKWQAHIMEHMLLDIDKQLEVMAHSESTPDASQWLTLLGMGQPASTAGGASRVARTVHRMLEGAGQVSVAGWTVQDCRQRWLAYLDALRPLLQQAEAAQVEYRSAQQAAAAPEAASSGGGSRRPRRAAAAAAAAVMEQEAAELSAAVPEPPAPAASLSPNQQQQQQQGMQHRDCSEPSLQRSDSCLPPAHVWSVEGVPQPLLSQIEQLVLETFYWLLAVMTSNPVLTYEFISMDLMDGTRPLPAQEHRIWADAVAAVQVSVEQMQECSTCIEVSRRCMAKVMEERAEIQQSMQCSVESEMHTHLSEEVLQLNSRDAAVDRMQANVRKESVVRNMVGFYCINVFSLYQLAKLALSCAPWFSMAWRVVGAMDDLLATQLAEAARQGSARGTSGSAHNTRASARLASQRSHS